VPVLSQESEWSCICVFGGIDFTSLYDLDIWIWNCFNCVVFFVLLSLRFEVLCCTFIIELIRSDSEMFWRSKRVFLFLWNFHYRNMLIKTIKPVFRNSKKMTDFFLLHLMKYVLCSTDWAYLQSWNVNKWNCHDRLLLFFFVCTFNNISFIVAISFNGGGNRRIRRKP
jgi:hypothetical protein